MDEDGLSLFGLQLPHVGFKLSRLPFQVTVISSRTTGQEQPLKAEILRGNYEVTGKNADEKKRDW